jgi:hypothetical protein
MVAICLTDLETIARKRGYPPPVSMPMPWSGASSQVVPCGDVAVKVACDLPEAVHTVTTDARMSPFARDLGVRSPEFVAFDDARDSRPVPFVVFRRVRWSTPIQQGTDQQRAVTGAERDRVPVYGIVLGTTAPVSLRTLRQFAEVDPRPWDVAGVPLDVVPRLLAGHRSVAPLPGDGSVEAPPPWCQIQSRLHAARSPGGEAEARGQLDRHLAQLRALVAEAELRDESV